MKLIPLLLVTLVTAVDIDKNTFSNYKDVKIQHIHIEWLLDLNNKVIDGSVEYTFKVFTGELKQVCKSPNCRFIWTFIR